MPLYLLDTNLEQNHPEDREITAQLYGGDLEMRIRQEIMLGIGGQRALEALGIEPTVCHMNEGHSAFLALERIRRTDGASTARASTRRAWPPPRATSSPPTRPVPAGNDIFPAGPDGASTCGTTGPQLGLHRDEFLGLGRINPPGRSRALLHGGAGAPAGRLRQRRQQAARRGQPQACGSGIWPELPDRRGPHRPRSPTASTSSPGSPATWPRSTTATSARAGASTPDDRTVWQRVEQIPDEELWRTHERLRERLVAFARRRLRKQLERRGAPAGRARRRPTRCSIPRR